MTRFGLVEATRLARRALAEGSELVLAVVVGAPEGDLIGRRLARDDAGLHGDLGDSARNEAARAVLADPPADPGCVELPGAGVELYVERIAPPEELVIVGAGHIAQPLAALGTLLGMRVTVLDDRPEFARRERFPDAGRVVVADFDEPFAGIEIGPRTRIVLVTRGHRYDYDCLRTLAAMPTAPAYIGMIGSKRRVRAAFEQLASEGVKAAWMARVHAPIGLDIEAETPAEIAVAVAAEMILGARGGTGRPLGEVSDVLRHVRALAAAGEGK